MQKVYRKLTADQKQRGVIFSSTLSTNRRDDELGQRTHEVMDTFITARQIARDNDKPDTEWLAYQTQAEEENRKTIERLLDDSFFKSSPWKYNVIRK